MTAHVAGWTLVWSMRDWRLHARRPSRRRRGLEPGRGVDVPAGVVAPSLRWRRRIIDEVLDEPGARLSGIDDGFVIVEYPV